MPYDRLLLRVVARNCTNKARPYAGPNLPDPTRGRRQGFKVMTCINVRQ